jgi:serine/threonine protein kinase/tetratricopeptide (TPR) repeat protein
MKLTVRQMALMSRLLDEALPLDLAARRRWLAELSPEHQDLAPALRAALLPDATGSAEVQSLLDQPAGLQDVAVASSRQPGARVGPYELLRSLGQGGMAEVWLARRADGAFKREVALKLPLLKQLRQDLAQRFAVERDILASLEHPGIARLYDAGLDVSGCPYLAMEYVQGQPLTDWCDEQCVGLSGRLKLFLQVLDAVRFAHEKQVIHRDLKPSNILVTERAQARLLDFGVAKLLEGDDAENLTRIYGRALTPDYASPELLRGDPVDVRSDIYSLGVLLYELLTGIRPYRLKSAASLGFLEQALGTLEIKNPSAAHSMSASAARRPLPAEKWARQLRGDLDAITLMALDREPSKRYQSVATFAADIERHLARKPIQARPVRISDRLLKFVLRNTPAVAIAVTALAALVVTIGYTIHREAATRATPRTSATAALDSTRVDAPERSVAVLPFVDMSERKDQEYFADGMSEEIIDLLAKVPSLRVPARTSSFYFKGKPTKVPEIARELGVTHVLEGSIRRSGNQIRVSAQLNRADNGYHLWSETYDRKLDDIFKVQDEIAGAVVKALKVSLLIEALPRASPTSSTEAYTLYLQAISMAKHPTRLSISKAVDYLQQAVKLDSKFAPAWAILSRLLVDEVVKFDVLPREQGREQALRAAETAVGLDSKLPEAHIAIGKILYQFDWDWSAAEAEFGKARDLDPGNGDALRWSGYVATTLGRLDDGLRLAQQSIALDPLYEYNYVGAGKVYLALGRIHEAEAAFRKAIDLNPADAIPHIGLADTLLALGEPAPALAEMQQVSLDDGQTIGLAIIYHAMGRKRESDAAMVEAEMKHAKDNIIGIAAAHAYRGETDHAFAWLDRAYRERDTRILGIKTDPYLKSLVAEPRYKSLLRKMNLPE